MRTTRSKYPRRKTVLPPPGKDKAADAAERKDKLYSDLLRKTLEAIMENKDGKLQPGMVAIEELSDDKQVIVEILDEESMSEGSDRGPRSTHGCTPRCGIQYQG